MRRTSRQWAMLVLGTVPLLACAQTAPSPPEASPARANADVPTLGEVRALNPEDDEPVPVRDPFASLPNRFAKRFKNPPTPEEVALNYNGYIMYGVIKGVVAGGRWLNKATGGPDQIQAAQARAAPLDDDQVERARRWTERNAD